jgi:RimJ/RimL family protein N-acetyltransferase
VTKIETPPAPVLTDGTITLRPWRADDADAVYRACQDPDIQRWTQVPVPYTRADAEGFVNELAPAAWRDGTGVVFAVVDASDALLASIGVVGIDRPNRSCEIGYWVAPDARRRGVASGATALLSAWVGEAFDVEHAELYTAPDNHGSQAVAARAGFRLVGEAERAFRGEHTRMLKHVRDVAVVAR